LLFVLFFASCASAFNPPASERKGPKPPDNSEKAECNTGSARKGTLNLCLSLRIPFGRMAHAPELSEGYLAVEYDRADPRMYTPQGLAYRLYAFSSVAAAGGNDVTVQQANGTRIAFRFPSGGSVAVPVEGASAFPNRLRRLDAAGNPATNATSSVWYEHWYSDGSRVRLSATNGLPDSVTTAAGRAVTPASCGVSVARDVAGGVRQVWSEADGLADVSVTVSNAAYEIRFYAPGDAGAPTNSAGLRPVSGAPVKVWRISNPDAAAGGCGRFVAVEERGAFALTNEWRYIQAKDDWVLDQSGGERRTLRAAEWNGDRTERMVRETVYGPAGKAPVSVTATRSVKCAWAMAETERVADPEGLGLAAAWAYYADPSQAGRYTHVRSVKYPDGSWEAFDYDDQGRVTLRVTPWLGQPASPDGRTAAKLAETGLAVSCSYAPLAAGDAPGLVDTRPRTVEARVAGTPVSRSYAAYVREADGSLTETRETCTDLSAAYGAASSLRAVTRRYAPGDANPAAASRVKSSLGADGVLRTFEYAAGAWAGSLADPGNAAAFAEAAGGAALRTTVTEGTLAAPDGIPGKTLRKVTYADAQGNAALSETWARSAAGFVRTSWTAAAHDAFHNATSRVDSAGHASSGTWAGKGLPSAAADGFGLSYVYGYDALGRLAAEVRLPAGGNPAVTNSFAYDALDRLTEASVSSGGYARRLLAASYDPAGRPASVTDADGRAVSFAYADGGRTVTAALPGGGTRILASWPGGAPRSVTGTAAAPPVWHSYGLEGGKLWTRVTAGSESSPSHVTRYADPAGRTVSVRHADGLSESLAYDLCGRLTNALDRAGRATRFSWDDAGNPLAVSRQADSGFATVGFGLDLAALAGSVTNEAGALVGLSVRDIPGRKATDTGIDGLPEVTRFAAGGRVASVSRRDGVLVSNVWDAAGRLAEVRHDGTPALGISYRADGLPLAASNAAASVSWTYDDLGRVVSETTRAGGGAPEACLALAINCSALTTNAVVTVSGTPCRVSGSAAYDAAERLSSLSGPAGTFGIAYGEADGLPVSVTNAALAEYCAYDVVGRVTNTVFRNASGATVGSFRYRYDASGFVTQKISSVNGPASTNAYAYDALGRLRSDGSVSYTYDLAGNRLSAGAAVFTYASNRLVSASGPAAAVAYDAAGNVTNMMRDGITRTLAWNTLGQLVSVSTNGALAESYAYDPLGRRVSTADGGGTVWHAYDGGQCVADLDASGRPIRSYTWGPGVDNLLAVTVYGAGATNSYYAVKDHLGSVHALIDSSGELVASYTYDAWGNLLSATINYSLLPITFSCRFLFQGREYSAATGLYNFRARWYAPELGRWLSPDPIGFEGGLNLYEFCGNNPVNFRDPGGLDASSLYDQALNAAVQGDYSRQDNGWSGIGAQTLVGLIPFIGQAADLRDTLANLGNVWDTPHCNDAWLGLLGAGIGWLPGVGDAAKGAMRGGRKLASEAGQAALRNADGAAQMARRASNLTPAGAGRRGALREALRRNGVPTSQQPSRTLPNRDLRGNIQPGRTYEYDLPADGGGTRTVSVRDDAAGHYYGAGDMQNRGGHFNDTAGNHYDY
jgi:RHS repeat-associated protein